MPVLPDVASRIVGPRVSAPDASPSRIIRAAARSFTEPPGFCHSAFAYSSTPRRLALEPVQPHERRPADQVEHGRVRALGSGGSQERRRGQRHEIYTTELVRIISTAAPCQSCQTLSTRKGDGSRFGTSKRGRESYPATVSCGIGLYSHPMSPAESRKPAAQRDAAICPRWRLAVPPPHNDSRPLVLALILVRWQDGGSLR